MTFDYTATAQTALGLLQRFGAAATLKRTTTSAYSPVSSTASVTVTELATTAAVLTYPRDFVDGSLILKDDRRALCAAGVAPKPGDAFVWQAQQFQVIAVREIAPAGVPVMFEAQIRGS